MEEIKKFYEEFPDKAVLMEIKIIEYIEKIVKGKETDCSYIG